MPQPKREPGAAVGPTPKPRPAPAVASERPKPKPTTCFVGLTQDEYEELCEFLPIIRAFRGCTTPIEQFILNLVRGHTHEGCPGLTMDDVLGEFDTFKENFEDAVRDAAHIMSQCPKEVCHA